ncbi:sensor histidine kinase [uncultured Jannaschia sp.]|uniref:sensor histidine kinase n=1 Tax=uncultured Jannaschia sp. TaxID=293347 RepID=UPI002622171D|nr:sensor histidine kinase [uncultured Jannaschia sp.]
MSSRSKEVQRAESNHRLANSLQLAAAMLRAESRRIDDVASARAALTAASLRLMAMGRLHGALSRLAPDEDVDAATYLEGIRSDIEATTGARIRINAAQAMAPAATAVQIGIIVTELAINSVKHGDDGDGPVEVTVDMVRDGSTILRLRVRDDGPGLPEGFALDGHPGLGMSIVTSTVERLDGTIRVRPGAGATFEIDLPLHGSRR